MSGLYNVKIGQERAVPVQVMAADGAITIKEGIVTVTKAGVCAMTLAAPVPGPQSASGDDGKILWIDSQTAQAHTLTIANGLRGAGASADLGTFTTAIGNGLGLYAHNGAWYPLPGTNTNVSFA
jgi:hypothetical protein